MCQLRTQFVYRILDRETGDVQGAYCRSFHEDYDFGSPEAARTANVHGIYENRERYKIAKYEVTYKLIEDDV